MFCGNANSCVLGQHAAMMYLLLRITFIFGSLTLVTVLSDTKASGWTPHRHSSGTGRDTDTTIPALEVRGINRSVNITHRAGGHPSGASLSDFGRTSTRDKARPMRVRSSDQTILTNRIDRPCNQHGKCPGNPRRTAELEVPGTDSAPSPARRTHWERRLRALPRPKRAAQDTDTNNTQIDKYDELWREATTSTTLERLPKPMAQNSTNFPFDFDDEFLPDHDFGEITPLVPFVTRSRENGLKNPFYPVTSETYGAYIVLILAVIIFCFGILGNITIMCIVCHNYYMRSISNSLLANLALWDFIILFFCLPLVVFHELTKTYLLGEFSCKIIPYIEVGVLHTQC